MKKSGENRYVGTDESSLAELCGYKVCAVEGKSTNIKLTDKNDYYLISAYLACEED
jgi:2-C-methyl-D-erythritol 4-phosphate cytidylyltransferase